MEILPCKNCGNKTILVRIIGDMFPFCQYCCNCGLEINGEAGHEDKWAMELSARSE